MSLIDESDMPATRLELRWSPINERGYNWRCDYRLVLELAEYDIRGGRRRRREKRLKLSNGTLTDRVRPPIDLARQEIDTPFRDGAHIQWDSRALNGLPMFAICEGKAMCITPKKGGAA